MERPGEFLAVSLVYQYPGLSNVYLINQIHSTGKGIYI